MKTKPYLGSHTQGGILSSLLMILCVLLILAVGGHLVTRHFSGGGMGMMGGDPSPGHPSPMDPSPGHPSPMDPQQPIMYPPRQMPMFGGGGLGVRLPQPTEGGMAWPPDVLRNPYAAPMKDDRYLVGPPMFPINVSTNPGAVDTSYRQIGTLSPNVSSSGSDCKKCKVGKCDGGCKNGGGGGGDGDLLILMGRPLFTNRDTWQYYAISNQRNGVKLPVRVGGKNATNEYGVRELNGGEVITVDGYNKRYQVGMYESDTIRYLP